MCRIGLVSREVEDRASIVVRTGCATVDEFVTAYAPFCDGPSCFFMTSVLREPGSVWRLRLVLAGGTSFFHGLAQVIESCTADDSAYGRAGIRLRFVDADPDDAPVLSRLMRASSEQRATTAMPAMLTQQLYAVTARSSRQATQRIGAIERMPKDTVRLLRSDFPMIGGELAELPEEIIDLPAPKGWFDAMPPEVERLLECEIVTEPAGARDDARPPVTARPLRERPRPGATAAGADRGRIVAVVIALVAAAMVAGYLLGAR